MCVARGGEMSIEAWLNATVLTLVVAAALWCLL
ncbi:hypothetical protein JOH52_002410 [Sinorhizobium meliloti]|uniref:Uncharacterized protein n=1 Tax=Sinorhizobium meliloti (strain SM11) TaxID=707241 RepID=F7X232_SINMM|nr:hypothetical protein SM11_chr0919 [Sinorhizobium meliloti SM11]MBP2466389.1 hypothetical protein [Sinorhizobium meliloti]